MKTGRKKKKVVGNKGFFLIAYCLLLIPFSASASFGEDLNNLLDKFFGTKKPVEHTIDPTTLKVPEVVVPENPTAKDQEEFQKKIEAEKKELADFEKNLTESRAHLWSTEEEKQTSRSQLQTLDEEVGLLSQKLEKFETQSAHWQEELEKLTRESSDMKALLRVKERELQNSLTKNYIRGEAFGGNTGVPVIKWLLSPLRVSEILEEQRLNTKFVQEKKGKLVELQYLKSKIEAEEKNAALLFHQISSLKENISAEKKTLTSFAEGKANLIARLEFTEGQTQKELENYDRQKMESELFLQKLSTGLGEIAEKTGIPLPREIPQSGGPDESGLFHGAGPLDFPLKISLQVLAGFHDPKYKQRMKKEHEGTDFYAPQGTDIYAPADGVVKKIGDNARGYGYAYMILDHGNKLFTVYGHIFDTLVNEGQSVKKGDRIALSGGTPGTKGAGYFTTGPHLHFEVFVEGEHRDPLSMINLQSSIINEKEEEKAESSKE